MWQQDLRQIKLWRLCQQEKSAEHAGSNECNVKMCIRDSIYSLWQEYTTEELNDIAEFCQTNKIMAVTIYRDYWSEEVQKIFDERDILVYIYTINDKEEARRYLANGAQGVCTDVLITDNLN